MAYEIRPQPDSLVRRAIVSALEQLEPEPVAAAYASLWWQAGVRENVEDDYATARRRPRRSPGATRA